MFGIRFRRLFVLTERLILLVQTVYPLNNNIEIKKCKKHSTDTNATFLLHYKVSDNNNFLFIKTKTKIIIFVPLLFWVINYENKCWKFFLEIFYFWITNGILDIIRHQLYFIQLLLYKRLVLEMKTVPCYSHLFNLLQLRLSAQIDNWTFKRPYFLQITFNLLFLFRIFFSWS